MTHKRTSEAAFETAIEVVLNHNGIHVQGMAAHRLAGQQAALDRQGQQQFTDPFPFPVQIPGQATHAETGHRIGGAAVRRRQPGGRSDRSGQAPGCRSR